jgi:tetratricopeptide (TPR) repeat protein
MKTGLLWVALTLAFATSYSQHIHAQDAETDEEARTLYSLGEGAFEQGRFQAALDYFQQAYDLSHRPQLLFNIGQAADRVRDDRRALAAFDAYLQALPNVENRRVVEARIEILHRAIAASQPAPQVVTPVTPTVVTPEATATSLAPDAPAAESHSSTGPWIIAGVGAGALVVGALFVALGAKDYNAVTDAPDGSTWDAIEDAHGRASTRITVGSILLGVGAAAGATGLALALRSGGDDTASLEVRVHANGLMLAGSF